MEYFIEGSTIDRLVGISAVFCPDTDTRNEKHTALKFNSLPASTGRPSFYSVLITCSLQSRIAR